jgi:hypothetical protein
VETFDRLVRLVEKIAAGEFMTEGERAYVETIRERDRCFSSLPLSLWSQVEYPALPAADTTS